MRDKKKTMKPIPSRIPITALLLVPTFALYADVKGDIKTETPEQAAARIAKMEKVADHALVPPAVNTSPWFGRME